MFTVANLVELALGEEGARKVDYSIPQPVFDQMTEPARRNIAGWYYAPESGLFGRLLTKDECWAQIQHKVKQGKLFATMGLGEMDEIGYVAADWPCFRFHVEQGHIILSAAK
jgi:hypothetical protein